MTWLVQQQCTDPADPRDPLHQDWDLYIHVCQGMKAPCSLILLLYVRQLRLHSNAPQHHHSVSSRISMGNGKEMNDAQQFNKRDSLQQSCGRGGTGIIRTCRTSTHNAKEWCDWTTKWFMTSWTRKTPCEGSLTDHLSVSPGQPYRTNYCPDVSSIRNSGPLHEEKIPQTTYICSSMIHYKSDFWSFLTCEPPLRSPCLLLPT